MNVHIVAGGQFGSEGKGAFTAAMVRELNSLGQKVTLVRVAGPNAGHTAYDDQGRKWALRQIPVGAVVDLEAPVILGQQSEIDLEVLKGEISALEEAGIPILNRLGVDHMATVIDLSAVEAEKAITTGTTGKGIGGARAARLMRSALTMRDINDPEIPLYNTINLLRAHEAGEHILIEGTQGYGLGLHTGYYPNTTSSNTRCGDFLAMTGLQPWEFGSVYPWVVFRAHPIRIAGASGPLMGETSWENLGQPPEYTTVTHRERRVGQWDPILAQAALEANGAPKVNAAFTFADYLWPEIKGETEATSDIRVRAVMVEDLLNHPVKWLGTGPSSGVFRPASGWTVER